MKRLGAVNAMNFDGGGSSTMVIGGSVVNSPSDGRERAVADGLLIYGNVPENMNTAGLHIAPFNMTGVPARVGEPIRFQVLDGDNKPIPAQNVVWGTADGFGFLSQQGVFTASKPGNGILTAWIGTYLLSVPVQAIATAPALPKPPVKTLPNGKPPIDPDDLP